MALGPFSVAYPVNFNSGGDTTRDAFGKHIQEIEKIYGILNALNADKVSASDMSGLSSSVSNINTALTKHINDTNPHPNYKPSISWSELTGTKPNLADFNGNLSTSRITGLQKFVEDLIPKDSGEETDKGDGITESNLAENGYAKFNNGLIIQWGKTERHSSSTSSYTTFTDTFPTSFSTVCYLVVPTKVYPNLTSDGGLQVVGWNTTSLVVQLSGITSSGVYLHYIAIGK